MLLAASCLCSMVIDVPALAALPAAAKKKTNADPVLTGLPITELSEDEAVQHALNRLAYGPRPGDVERVKQMGLAKWIEQQLNPKSIDDRAVQARLEQYPTLAMSTAQLMAEYPNPKQAAQPAQAAQNTQAPTPEQMAQRQADAAITAMAQEMDRNSGAAGASANDGEAEGTMVAGAGNSDVPSPMKTNPATPGAGQRGALSVDRTRCRGRLQTTARGQRAW